MVRNLVLTVLYLSLILFSLYSIDIEAASITADSCSYEDVSKVVARAQDGDIILIPSGTATWDQTLVVNTGITLKGIGGAENTIIIDGTAEGYKLVPILIHGHEGSQFRLTGLTFKGPVNDSNGFINIDGTCKNFRIDHCIFDDVQRRATWIGGYSFGVIDHCTFREPGNNACQAISVLPDAYDDQIWEDPLDIGKERAIYIEDCFFDFATDNDGAVDGRAGARIVFRNNIIHNTNFGTHGRDSGGFRSTLLTEVYRNKFEFKNFDGGYGALTSYRGGTGVVFNNDYIVDRPSVIKLSNYCSCYGNTPGQCVFDKCVEYPCMDQVGRGPDQTAEPIYIWNNVHNGVKGNLEIQIGICEDACDHIQENRDFFNDKARPDYIPYVYPHPLTLSDYTDNRVLNLRSLEEQDRMKLSWDTIGGAVTYVISRNWQEVSQITETEYLLDSNNETGSYMVYAYDTDGNMLSAEGIIIQSGDNTAPGIPTNFTAVMTSQNSITLSWTASTDDVGVKGYRIYRNGAAFDTTESSSYSDIGISADTLYRYTVTAYDEADNESLESNAVIKTAGCEYDNVNEAIETAQQEDTVLVPEGTATWTKMLTINKGIMLLGAGIDKTIIKYNGPAGYTYVITVAPDLETAQNDYPLRISGFTFKKLARAYATILLENNNLEYPLSKVMVDHNKFINLPIGESNFSIELRLAMFGVVHNNIMQDGTASWRFLGTLNKGKKVECWVPGSANAMYFEDNYICTVNAQSSLVISGGNGNRYVSRYNTFDLSSRGTPDFAQAHDIHGNQPNNGGAGIGIEIYGNHRIGTAGRWVDHRGGQVFFFYNRWSDSNGKGSYNIWEEYNDDDFSPSSAEGTSYPQTDKGNIVQRPHDSYYWRNFGGIDGKTLSTECNVLLDHYNREYDSHPAVVNDPPLILENQNWWRDNTEVFDGTIDTVGTCGLYEGDACTKSGIGYGTMDEMKAITPTAAGLAFWVTDQEFDLEKMTGHNPERPIRGTLYRSVDKGNGEYIWEEYYTPYTYPHPLRTSGPMADDTAPVIVRSPQNQVAAVGEDVTFSVEAYGIPELEFQWQFKGQDLIKGNVSVAKDNDSGLITSTLTINDIEQNDEGEYSVIVSNLLGDFSESAELKIVNGLPKIDKINTTVENYTVHLNWMNPDGQGKDWDRVLVVRKEGEMPPDGPEDGEIIYDGNGTSAVDRDLTAGIYYYAGYTYKEFENNKVYSEPEGVGPVEIPETYNKKYLSIRTGQEPHILTIGQNTRGDLYSLWNENSLVIGRGPTGNEISLWLYADIVGNDKNQIPLNSEIVNAGLIFDIEGCTFNDNLTKSEGFGFNSNIVRTINIYQIADPYSLGKPYYPAESGIRTGLDFNYRDHRSGINKPWVKVDEDKELTEKSRLEIEKFGNILKLIEGTEPIDSIELPAVFQEEKDSTVNTIQLDITDAVQDWVDGEDNQGLYITTDKDWMKGEGLVLSGTTAEREESRPLLEIVYAEKGTELTAPDAVSEVEVSPGDSSITLNWINPDVNKSNNTDVAGVKILRREGMIPYSSYDGENSTDGISITYLKGKDEKEFTDTGLEAGTTYYYALYIYDNDHNYSNGVWVKAVSGVLTEAPIIAANSLIIDSGQVSFSWSPVTGAGSYRVYRKDISGGISGEGSIIGLDKGSEIYSANGWLVSEIEAVENQPGTFTEPLLKGTYLYRVIAVNKNGEGPLSDKIEVIVDNTNAADKVPADPSVLEGKVLHELAVELNWSDNSDNEVIFVIERQNREGEWEEIGISRYNEDTNNEDTNNEDTSSENTYIDREIPPVAQLSYRIKAVNSAGSSGYSNILNINVPVSGISWEVISASQIRVEWTGDMDSVNYRAELYELDNSREIDEDDIPLDIQLISNAHYCYFIKLEPGKKYRVKIISNNNNEEMSIIESDIIRTESDNKGGLF